MSAAAGGSTLAEMRDAVRPPALWLRRLALLLMLALVVADLAGALGTNIQNKTAQGGGYRLSLEYPAIARAGQDITWRVTVSHPGGFGKQLTVGVTGDYFDIFESQGFSPEPSQETRDGEIVYLTFDTPSGDTFVVDYDAYIQPASQVGRSARVAVMSNQTPVVWVDYSTRLVP
jgi:hypothetical protein